MVGKINTNKGNMSFNGATAARFSAWLVRRLRTENRFAAGVVTGVCTGFVAFAVTSVFHYNLGEEPIAMALFFGYGLAVALDRITTAGGSIDAPLQ